MNRNICFAVLVQNKRDVVVDLLDNIRTFCPDSSIVLYNGGNDPDLCKDLGYPVCPTSRKLSYGVTAIYILEVMRWLEDTGFSYEYLINLDSDALFAREGFERFISEEMRDKDYMGVGTKTPDDDFYCLIQLRKEKQRWEPVIGNEPYKESFNVGQVYSKRLVRSILKSEKFDLLFEGLRKTKAFGVDELVYVTYTQRLGFDVHPYPKKASDSIRYRPYFPLDDVIGRLNRYPESSLFHPIYRRMGNETRAFVRELMKRKIQSDPQLQKSFAGQYLGVQPYMIRREKYKGKTIEWLAASRKGGMLYWRQSREKGKMNLYGPYSFGSGKVESIAALDGRFGNLEAVCRIGSSLVHYVRVEKLGEWYPSEPFAKGAAGKLGFIESSYGNFEVVSPLRDGGIGHWYRINDNPRFPWRGPVKFGSANYDEAILVENDEKQLTAVARYGDKYHYFVRDDRKSWDWFGPYD
ncbi:hypothetical protein [Paenibacillus thermotolerans]|uniref:hypothetical protein n=1 Tax=Paenibacillus thermotolerans TaxID=3027807 RepID=UPI00236859E0|nr:MULTISPECIES: hypothetical protein [unclassified Paenibacillus]